MSMNEKEISLIKRKDPKHMTNDELDEYIKRNRPKAKLEDNKSMNTSFHSHRLNNFSFDKGINRDYKKQENDKTSNRHEKENSIVEPSSDGEGYFKFKGGTLNLGKEQNDSTYVKTLLDKIKTLSVENEEAKKSFIEVSELLEKVSLI
jgi:hypothetical protein